ncbi:MAG: DUF6788 family protein [Actinomycetes bacterium]
MAAGGLRTNLPSGFLGGEVAEPAQTGFISPDRAVVRSTSCGKPGCRCQADPHQRHGPVDQWPRGH